MQFWDEMALVYPSLARVPRPLRQDIVELGLSCRAGASSLCVVFGQAASIKRVAPEVPDVITERIAHRYAVDLESLGTAQERFYVDLIDDPVVTVRGWVCAHGAIVQEKVYRRVGPGRLEVDRHTPDGQLISAGEPEFVGDDSDWSGAPGALDLARRAVAAEAAAGYLVLKKLRTDQSYIRLYGVV